MLTFCRVKTAAPPFCRTRDWSRPMSLFSATLHALAPLFLLILLGYGLKRARVLHAAHVPILNSLVINVTLPALIFKGLAQAPHLPLRAMLLPLAALCAEAVALGIALALGRALRLSRPMRGALLMTGTFGNTSFLGYPITLALLPRQFPLTILIDQFGMTIAMYACAALVGSAWGPNSDGAGGAARAMGRFFRSPIFLSVVVGCVALLVPRPAGLVHLPLARGGGSVVMQCIGYLGQGTTPLVLLGLGVSLRPNTARAFGGPIGAACGLKLLVCPVAMWLVCRALGLHGDMLKVGILEEAMPTAVMASVLSTEYQLAGDYAVGVVFVGTALSALTVPILLSILH